MGVYEHEILHCALGHPWRRDARDAKRWNVACDYAINPVIVERGKKLPAGALIDAQYSGKSAEWIYDRVPQPEQDGNGKGQQGGDKQQGAGQGDDQQQGQGGGGQKPDGSELGEVRDAPSSADDNGNEQNSEQAWKEAVQQAANIARKRGTLPGSLDRFAKAVVVDRVDL